MNQAAREARSHRSPFAGATTDGERVAAADARRRIQLRLQAVEQNDPPIEYRLTAADAWSARIADHAPSSLRPQAVSVPKPVVYRHIGRRRGQLAAAALRRSRARQGVSSITLRCHDGARTHQTTHAAGSRFAGVGAGFASAEYALRRMTFVWVGRFRSLARVEGADDTDLKHGGLARLRPRLRVRL